MYLQQRVALYRAGSKKDAPVKRKSSRGRERETGRRGEKAPTRYGARLTSYSRREGYIYLSIHLSFSLSLSLSLSRSRSLSLSASVDNRPIEGYARLNRRNREKRGRERIDKQARASAPAPSTLLFAAVGFSDVRLVVVAADEIFLSRRTRGKLQREAAAASAPCNRGIAQGSARRGLFFELDSDENFGSKLFAVQLYYRPQCEGDRGFR